MMWRSGDVGRRRGHKESANLRGAGRDERNEWIEEGGGPVFRLEIERNTNDNSREGNLGGMELDLCLRTLWEHDPASRSDRTMMDRGTDCSGQHPG